MKKAFHEMPSFSKQCLGSIEIWTCQDCSYSTVNDTIKITNEFSEPNDFEISTDIFLAENQNVRLTVTLVDYVANLIRDNSMARSSIEAFLDYGNNALSPTSKIICSNDCLKGTFGGDLGKFEKAFDISNY